MVIIINPTASGGKAIEKWKKIETSIVKQFGPLNVIYPDKKRSMQNCIADALDRGNQEFIAGGGDGTVNLLLESLIERVSPEQLNKIKIGAIGLGSSNDFHKPFKPDQLIKGVPYKINFTSAAARDVGILTAVSGSGQSQQHYWLINASIGITAEANLFFNTPDFILNYLKRTKTAWAILYAALRTIVSYGNRPVAIKIGKNHSQHIHLTNMGIVKSPHFSGNLSYNTPFRTDNGQFYINICRDMNLIDTLHLLWNLSKNRFLGLPKTDSVCSDRLSVHSDQPFAVEFDGEVVTAKQAMFYIKPKMIGVCTC